jgi:hypothetical protein
VEPLLDSAFGKQGVDWGALIKKGISTIGSLFGGGPSFEVPANNFDLMARGGAFVNGRPTPFGSGGIVNAPTIFPFANGIGLMGERGTEAIMPLTRTASGDLGVKASGGGGVKVEIHNYAGSQITAEASPDGSTLRILVEKMTLDALNRNPGAVANAWTNEAQGGNRKILNTLRRLG